MCFLKIVICVFFSKDLPLSQNWNNIFKLLSHHKGGVMMTRSVLLGKHVKDSPFWFQVLIMPSNMDTTEAQFAALPFDKFTVSSRFTPSCTPSTSAFQKHQQQNSSAHCPKKSGLSRQRAGHFCQCSNALGVGCYQNKCSSALPWASTYFRNALLLAHYLTCKALEEIF
jgi:hypothetical protein